MIKTVFLLIQFSMISANNQPHIIFILADDLGWNDVSFHGSLQIPTPNLDALAFSGVMLQNYYVTPLCTPSRSALMTGKHPIHTGMQHDVLYGYSRWGLPLNESILPNYLNLLGYKNYILGKWHLGHFIKEHTPLYRGFDSHYGYWTGHQDYYDHTHVEGGSWGFDMRRNFSVEREAFGKYTTRLIGEEARQLITNHNPAIPMFLYIAHLAVHSANGYSPLQAPRETIEMFQYIKDVERRRFAAMVYELDLTVGQLVQDLAANNMLENSIIIFSSDNGGPAAGFNQNAASNWPLKGVKNTPWEGGVRAAGFVWSPIIPLARRGQIMTNLMDISDWLPTLFEAAGGNVSFLKNLDGVSHWKTILYDAPSLRSHILHNIDDQLGYAALRKRNWKLVKGTTYGGRWDSWYGPSGRDNEHMENLVDSNEYKLKVKESDTGRCLSLIGMAPELYIDRKRSGVQVDCGVRSPEMIACEPLRDFCLFDIDNDPCEFNNLASQKPDVVQHLLDLLNWYNRTALVPLNTPPDPLSNPKFWNYTYTNWVDFLPLD